MPEETQRRSSYGGRFFLQVAKFFRKVERDGAAIANFKI